MLVRLGAVVLIACACGSPPPLPPPMEQVTVSEDGRHFRYAESGEPFVPSGFNYDHDSDDRLLEEELDPRDLRDGLVREWLELFQEIDPNR